MAKNKLVDYDSTASGNLDVGGISVAEGMLPSNVNNAIREQMSHLKDFADGTEAINALAVDNLKMDGNTISSTDTNGDITLDPNGTGDIVLDANVGIGTSSPAASSGYTILTLNNATNGGVVRFENNGSFKGSIYNSSSQFRIESESSTPLVFANSTERMRIDSSGNLLVGKTTTASATQGIAALASGTVVVTATSDYPLLLNRLTSDGDIALFRKDGTTVGSIDSVAGLYTAYKSSGSTLYLGVNSSLDITLDSTRLRPTSDATMSLGTGSNRFTDLSLSGGVYLGGTGSANKLDDYEEGTTLVTATPGTSGTITLDTGIDRLFYTKVGRVVTLTGLLQPSAVSSPTGTYVLISPLPFTASSTFYSRASNTMAYRASGSPTYTDYANAVVFESGTSMYVYTDASTWSNSPISQLQINISYITD
jgi:hypothetical protein